MKESKWFDKLDWNSVFQRRVEPPKVSFKQTEKLDSQTLSFLSNFSFQSDEDREEPTKDIFSDF